MPPDCEIIVSTETYERLLKQGREEGFDSPSLYADHLLKELHLSPSQLNPPLMLCPENEVSSCELHNNVKSTPKSPR